MPKKYNIRDNFEDVYLRSRQARLYINQANPALMKDADFKRTTLYIAKRFYDKHRHTYYIGGFEFDDIHSITTFFGLMFAGYNKKFPTTRDFYMVMMRFLNQRLSRMVDWIIKKFQKGDLADPYTIEIARESFHKQLRDTVVIDGVVMDNHVYPTMEHQYQMLEEEICTLEQQYEQPPPTKEGRIALKEQIEKITTRLKKYRTEQQQKRRVEKAHNIALRKRMEQDWENHTDALAYYAVSRFVATDTRKVARKYCTKYGIDYGAWAASQIRTEKMSASDIVMG